MLDQVVLCKVEQILDPDRSCGYYIAGYANGGYLGCAGFRWFLTGGFRVGSRLFAIIDYLGPAILVAEQAVPRAVGCMGAAGPEQVAAEVESTIAEIV